MKSKLILLVLLSFPIFSYGQLSTSTKTFSVKELLMTLDSLPSDKLTDVMHEHGFAFESKGNVYSPYVKGPVKNAYTLRYLKDKQHFIVSFYAGEKYLVKYFLGNEKEFDSLEKELVPVGFQLIWQKGDMNYYDLNKFRMTTARSAAFKIFSLADRPVVEKYHLMPF